MGSPVQFYLTCSARSGNTLTVSTTATEGTTTANMAIGAVVTQVVSAGVLTGLKADLPASLYGTYGSLPSASSYSPGTFYKCTDCRYWFLNNNSTSWQAFYNDLGVTPPPAASTMNYSLNTSSSNITLTSEYGGITASYTGTGSSSENWGLIGKAYPTSSFTWVIGIEVMFTYPTYWTYFGMGVTDGTKGIMHGAAVGNNSVYGFGLDTLKYNSTSSYNSAYVGQNTASLPPTASGVFYLKWQDDLSSTRYCQFSQDMVHWEDWNIPGGVSRTDFLTPTNIGFIFGQSTNSTSTSAKRAAFKIFHWSGL